jgi:hypothetical protein
MGTGDDMFDQDKVAGRVKNSPCCCSKLGEKCVMWIFGLLSFGLLVCGVGVLIASGGFGDGS